MITIRHIRDTDDIAKYWAFPSKRPGPLSLVAIDSDGKVQGICWLATDHLTSLIALYFSASPSVAWILGNGVIQYAYKSGYKSILLYLDNTRLLRVLTHRYSAISYSKPTYQVGIPVVNRG